MQIWSCGSLKAPNWSYYKFETLKGGLKSPLNLTLLPLKVLLKPWGLCSLPSTHCLKKALSHLQWCKCFFQKHSLLNLNYFSFHISLPFTWLNPESFQYMWFIVIAIRQQERNKTVILEYSYLHKTCIILRV